METSSFLTRISQIYTDQRKFDLMTERVIGCAFEVANTLGRGFVERVYANALAKELHRHGLSVRREYPVKVYYKEDLVGEFFCDLLVEGKIIVETKATSGLNNLQMAQCLNYLKATGFRLCLLVNFGSASVQIKRIVNGF